MHKKGPVKDVVFFYANNTMKRILPVILQFVPVIILFLTCSSVFAAEPDTQLAYWKKILHYDGEQSMVVSDSFFLYEHGNIDYRGELNRTMELLNSENGKLIACNYPARYSWIKTQGFNVQPFDLENCSELNKYVSDFQKDSLSLVFVSEHIDSPQSAFGHILLVFHDENMPLLTADTIHFAAETPDDHLMKYAYKGLSGGYYGYFFRTPFYIIKNNYSIIEQRSLFFYRLDLNRDQIKTLIYHLYELRKAKFKYYFLRENCAFYLASLLETTYENSDSSYNNSMYVLPIDIINSYKDKDGYQYVIEPSIMRAQRLFEQMTPEDKQAYSSVTNGNLKINDNLPDKVKETLAIGHEYSFRRYRKVMPDYDKAVRLKFNNSLPAVTVKDPSYKKGNNILGVGFYTDRNMQGIIIQYRPVGKDIYEHNLDRLQESQLVLMNMELLVSDKNKIHLQRLDLISANSIFSRSKLASKFAWGLDIGINRQNTYNNAVFDFNFGLGQGFANSNIGVGYLLSAGMQNDDSEGNVYFKPVANLMYYPINDTKIGVTALLKKGKHGRYNENTFYISKDINATSIVTRHIMSNSVSGDTTMLILRRYF